MLENNSERVKPVDLQSPIWNPLDWMVLNVTVILEILKVKTVLSDIKLKYVLFFITLIVFFGCGRELDDVESVSSVIADPTEASPITFLSDLMNGNKYRIDPAFKSKIKKTPSLLRYGGSYRGRSKCIFHKPFPGETNTISLPNLQIQGDAKIRFSTGLFSQSSKVTPGSNGVRFEINAVSGERRQQLFEHQMTETNRWEDFSIDLSEYDGQTITLILLTNSLSDSLADMPVWGSPRFFSYSVEDGVETKEIRSALRYSGLLNQFRGKWLQQPVRTDRGWIIESRITEINLPGLNRDEILQTEVFVLEQSDRPDEEVLLELLDTSGAVIRSENAQFNQNPNGIINEFKMDAMDTIPDRVRLTLNEGHSSLVFIKEPMIHRSRNSDSPGEMPNVILISLDTLRADRLGCYGYSKPVSPNIDKFAEESFVFTDAFSNSNWTLPSHLSMFTSLYPATHQVVLKSWSSSVYKPYHGSEYFITEAFKQMGYSTLAFTGGGFVSSRYGFNTGFDEHIEDVVNFNSQSMALLNSIVEPYINDPLFLFLHTYEIHDYYKEKQIHKKFVDKKLPKDRFSLQSQLRVQNALQLSAFKPIRRRLLPPARHQYAKDLYDGAIFYTDELIGRFFDRLKDWEIYDNSWIIITSDHGEGFGESHNNGILISWKHGSKLYNDQIQIPMIIKPPKGFLKQAGSGRRISHSAEIIDIAPTLSSILSIQPNEQFEGVSLAPLLTSPDASIEAVKYADDLYDSQFAVISKNYKLIARPSPLFFFNGEFRYELYNLLEDSAESKNLRAKEFSPILREMKRLLDDHLKSLPSFGEIGSQLREEPEVEIDADHIKRLKDLGYL